MQTLFRKSNAGDVEAILPLWRELMEFHSNLDSRYRLVSDAAIQAKICLCAELDAPASLLAVAEHDSRIVAYCRAAVQQSSPIFERRAHGFVSEFHVSHGFRRRGIGRNFFQFVRRWFEEQGVARIELLTLNANADSNAFWQSVGCQPFAERRAVELGGG